MKLFPLTLSGKVARLEPLAPGHARELAEAIAVDELWKLRVSLLPAPDQMDAYIAKALAEQKSGSSLPFAVVHATSGRAIGGTRFLNYVAEHKRIEIGFTWYGTLHQRTRMNTEAKLLLLAHAFETLGLNRVEFKTHHENLRSQAAIARLGATREGVFRHHMIMPDGHLRDTVYFSIIIDEWPQVKARLLQLLERPS